MRKYYHFMLKYLVIISLFLLLQPVAAFSSATIKWEAVSLVVSEKTRAAMPAKNAGEGMQQVMQLSYDPSDSSRIFMATDSAAIWLSENAGKSWKSINDGYYGHGAISVLPLSSRPGVVIAAANCGSKSLYTNNQIPEASGIYISHNSGKVWKHVQTAAFYTQMSRCNALLELKTNKGDILLAASYYDLFYSLDYGESWQRYAKKLELADICQTFKTPDSFFALDRQGALVEYVASLDSSNRLLLKASKIETVSGHTRLKVTQIASTPVLPGNLLATCGKMGIFYKKNNSSAFQKISGLPPGHDWQAITASRTAPLVILASAQAAPVGNITRAEIAMTAKSSAEELDLNISATWTETQRDQLLAEYEYGWGYFAKAMAIDPKNSSNAVMCTNGKEAVYRSTNGGKYWQYSGYGYSATRLSYMAFTQNAAYFALTDHGLFRMDRNSGHTTMLNVPRVNGQRSVGPIIVSNKVMIAAVGQWNNKNILYTASSIQRGSTQDLSTDKRHSDYVFGRKNTWRPYFSSSAKLSVDIQQQLLPAPFEGGFLVGKNFVSMANGNAYPLDLPERITTLYRLSDDLYAGSERGGATIITFRLKKTHPNAAPAVTDTKKVSGLPNHPISMTLHDGNIYALTSQGLYTLSELKSVGWSKIDFSCGYLPDNAGRYTGSSLLSANGVLLAGRNNYGFGKSSGIFVQISSLPQRWKQLSFVGDSNQTIWSLHFDPIEKYIYAGTSIGTFRVHIDEISMWIDQQK